MKPAAGRRADDVRVELSDRVRDKELFAFVELPTALFAGRPEAALLHRQPDLPAAAPLARGGRRPPGHRRAAAQHQRRPADDAGAGPRDAARSPRACSTRGGDGRVAPAKVSDPIRSLRHADGADDADVRDRHLDRVAAPQQRHGGEDDADQRGAARLAVAVRADGRQAARRRRGVDGAVGDLPDRRLRLRRLPRLRRRGDGDADRLVRRLPGAGDADLRLAVHRHRRRRDRPQGRPGADDAGHDAVHVADVHLDADPAGARAARWRSSPRWCRSRRRC